MSGKAEIAQNFQLAWAYEGNEETCPVEVRWNIFREALYVLAAKKVLGVHRKKNKPWISGETLKAVPERRKLKERLTLPDQVLLSQTFRQGVRTSETGHDAPKI